jgi:hypothetical protein
MYCILHNTYYSTNVTGSPSYVQCVLLKPIQKFLIYITMRLLNLILKLPYIAVHVSTDTGHHQVFKNCWGKLLCFHFVILIFDVWSHLRASVFYGAGCLFLLCCVSRLWVWTMSMSECVNICWIISDVQQDATL